MSSPIEQAHQDSLELQQGAGTAGPVECLGQTFENDQARRQHFLTLLKEKLQDPDFREMPGFPEGTDDDILNLSDPPFYTACPNPFLPEIIAFWRSRREGKEVEGIELEPYCSDVAEGKGGSLYKAHTYHTKVPPEAIAKYILHYTNPGDIVLDIFAGSGTTGLGAALSANSVHIGDHLGNAISKIGKRNAILVDLSPFATFLCSGANSSLSSEVFTEEATSLIAEARRQLPEHPYGEPEASYIIWSQVLICPSCLGDISFWDAAINKQGNISSSFMCPHCNANITKGKCDRKMTTSFDYRIGKTITQNLYAPCKKMPLHGRSMSELSVSDKIACDQFSTPQNNYVPILPMMNEVGKWGDMFRAGYHAGVSHVHHFWSSRNLKVLSTMWEIAEKSPHANHMKLLLTSFMVKTGSRMHNIGMKNGKINLAGQIFNTLQIPSVIAERNLFELASGKISDLKAYYQLPKSPDYCAISTSSGACTGLPHECIDYVFVDPPFGKNIMYSEMSFLYEAWLGVRTSNQKEAIVSSMQGKGLAAYKQLMTDCFKEIHRVLKPGRWMTVAFHNSRNDVWNALQEAIREGGLVIGDVRIIDKGQGTFKQMTTAGAVEKDLAISAYRPSASLEAQIALDEADPETCWSFIREHLAHSPISIIEKGALEILRERTPQLLFDRMIAYHVAKGKAVPVNASSFYQGLSQRFPERDGMYFLPDQVASYDRKRITATELRQLSFFVNDEHSAIQWVRQKLQDKPQSFQSLQPQYTPEVRAWAKHEQNVELKEILNQNFLFYDGDGPVPSQIHSYLSTNFKDLRNLEKDSPRLREKAAHRWYVPATNRQGDVERVREKALLKEFEEIKQSTQKKLKIFRTEAIRAGFKACWQERDFCTIISIAAKLPVEVLQEDGDLILYYDNAKTLLGDDA